MLSFQAFFVTCTGLWTTERTYHSTLRGEVERSYTEFRVDPLTAADKQNVLSMSQVNVTAQAPSFDLATLASDETLCPGFSIAFDTRSEKGEQVSMSLKALFVPDRYLAAPFSDIPPPPLAAQVTTEPTRETIQGFYLRDEGYSEAGAIAGRFTYQPTRQTLEMTTYYRRSCAVDQMRIIAPDLRLRTIVTYQRPEGNVPPSVIDLVGFGVERKQPA
ncbi:MAG TPA: phycobiliprotein lyase [Thermosynechococcaceae cyanobacterium]